VVTTPSYAEPYGWWGPGGRQPGSLSLAGLVVAGTLSLPAAAFLAAAVRQRWSLAVIAGPSGAGKSTLLSALLPWLPPHTRRFYLRGGYERFAFLDDPATDPHRSAVLCNEISPHLPIYLWGDGVERLLVARRRGFQIAATAHAADALGFVRLLSGPPHRIAADLVAGFDLVVRLGLGSGDAGDGPRRVVTGIWWLRSGRPGTVEIEAVGDDRSVVPDLGCQPRLNDQVWRPAPVDRDAVAVAAAEITVLVDAESTAAAAPERSPAVVDRQAEPPAPWRPRRSRPNG